jgi:hypothetical protein
MSNERFGTDGVENPKSETYRPSHGWYIWLVLLAEPNPEMYYLHRRKPGCDVYLQITGTGKVTPFPNTVEASWDM